MLLRAPLRFQRHIPERDAISKRDDEETDRNTRGRLESDRVGTGPVWRLSDSAS